MAEVRWVVFWNFVASRQVAFDDLSKKTLVVRDGDDLAVVNRCDVFASEAAACHEAARREYDRASKAMDCAKQFRERAALAEQKPQEPATAGSKDESPN